MEHADGSRGQDDGAFDQVLQLTNVFRPSVSRQGLHRLGRDRLDGPVHPTGVVFDEMPHEQWDVFRTLVQQRNVNGEDIEAIKQVSPKLLLVDQHGKIPLRGRDQSSVTRD